MERFITQNIANMGRKDVALRNLPTPPAGGRPRMSPEQKQETKAKRMGLLARMKEYLESGEAEDDFDKMREKMVDKALDMAMNRTIGPVKQSVEHSGELKIEGVQIIFGDGKGDK